MKIVPVASAEPVRWYTAVGNAITSIQRRPVPPLHPCEGDDAIGAQGDVPPACVVVTGTVPALVCQE